MLGYGRIYIDSRYNFNLVNVSNPTYKLRNRKNIYLVVRASCSLAIHQSHNQGALRSAITHPTKYKKKDVAVQRLYINNGFYSKNTVVYRFFIPIDSTID